MASKTILTINACVLSLVSLSASATRVDWQSNHHNWGFGRDDDGFGARQLSVRNILEIVNSNYGSLVERFLQHNDQPDIISSWDNDHYREIFDERWSNWGGSFTDHKNWFGARRHWSSGSWHSTWDKDCVTAEVPVPAAAWLFGTALLGLGGLRRRK